MGGGIFSEQQAFAGSPKGQMKVNEGRVCGVIGGQIAAVRGARHGRGKGR